MSESKYKYPQQVVSVKRKSKIIEADAVLTLPTENETVPPLEIHSGFSRFVITIIDNSGDKTVTPKANIPAREVAFIKKMTDVAIDKLSNGSATKSADASANSTAYTQKLFDNRFKGKTPAQVLLENPEEKDNLINVKNWLQQNLQKYPKNAGQIKAIEDAIKLFEENKLSEASVTSSNITLYSSDYKYRAETNDKGYNKVYSISIICDPSRDYPFTVNITECFAPVETMADGMKNIKMTEAMDMVKTSFSMSTAEWYNFIRSMHKTVNYFENMVFSAQFAEMKANSYEHKK